MVNPQPPHETSGLVASASRTAKPQRGIQSVEQGGAVLLALARHGRAMPLRDLAHAVGMAPGKAHPYLVSLGKLGLVTQQAHTGHYWLGPTAIELGLAGLHQLDPMREAVPHAQQLAETTTHGVALSVWGSMGPTVVQLIDALYPLHVNLRPGTVMAVDHTATGWLFAHHMPRALIEQTRAMTAAVATTASRGQLSGLPADPDAAADAQRRAASAEQDIQLSGMTRTVGYPNPGVTALAAPVFDHSGQMVLSLTLMGRSAQFDPEWGGAEARQLQACVRQISARLGHRFAS